MTSVLQQYLDFRGPIEANNLMEQRMYEGFSMYQFFNRLDRTHIAELSSKELTDVACKLWFLKNYKVSIKGVVREFYDEMDNGMRLMTIEKALALYNNVDDDKLASILFDIILFKALGTLDSSLPVQEIEEKFNRVFDCIVNIVKAQMDEALRAGHNSLHPSL